jgi:hypothetical protein
MIAALTSNTVLAIAGVTSIVFARSVSIGDCGVIPTGAVVGAGVAGLGLVSLIRRVRRKEFRRTLFPAGIMVLGLVCSSVGHARYGNFKAMDHWGLSHTSMPMGVSVVAFPGVEDLMFDQQHTSMRGRAGIDEAADEAMRRSKQSWWPEAHLTELSDKAPEHVLLTSAAIEVLDVTARSILNGQHHVALPNGQRDLYGRLTQANRELLVPSRGQHRMQYVRMWPNTFRVLYYPAKKARDWTAAIQVTVLPDGTMKSETFALAPEAHLPRAQNGRWHE